MPAPKPRAIYIVKEGFQDRVYGPAAETALAELLDIAAPPQTPAAIRANPGLLQDVEVILSSWGMPALDPPFLVAAPRLRMVFYAAGSIRGFTTDAMWNRGIRVVSAYAANAVPVAEFTLGAILLALKQAFQQAQAVRTTRTFTHSPTVAGGYGSAVGLISLGMIGRMVRERLRPFDVNVLAYDPFLKPDEAARLGVEPAALDELFRRADVVSLHTPWLRETERMIRGEHIRSMKPGATFINTARGAVVAEDELVDALRERTDLQAVLDVTWPEPPPPDSPLYGLPNVFLTPHIAGSQAAECRRMGRIVVDEVRRWLRGDEMKYVIDRAKASLLA